MDKRISFRLDAELDRYLRETARQRKTTMTAILKEAIREKWKRLPKQPAAPGLSAREVYSTKILPNLEPPQPGPKRDRARNAKKLFREILLDKRRNGTL
jgi:hypothetical protein